MEAIEYYKEDEHTPLTREQIDAAVEATADAPDKNGTLARYRRTPWSRNDAQRTTSAAPAAPTLENGDTVVKDGKGMTMFGKYGRVVDQKTGKEKWINTETGQEEVPKSEQMRQMMAQGHTSLGVQSAGFKTPFVGADSWDAALAAQKSGEQAEALAKSRAYGAQLLERQNYDNEQVKKRLTNRRLAAGDAFGVALSGLNGEIARTDDGKIIGKDGNPVDRRVRVSADGKHIYLMSSVSPSVLKAANDQRRKNGGASDYNSIIAYREIDVNGNSLKDKNGNDIPPYIAVRDTPGGQSGTDVKQRFRTMSLRDISDKILQAHRDAGHGDDDTIKTATVEQLGGWDPNGWFSGRAERVNAIGKGGGSGVEIARINAEQKEKDRAAKTAKSDREMVFKERKFEYGVSKDMAKEAKDFFSSLSDEDKEMFAKKYPQMAKSILGLANGSEEPSEKEPTGDDEFVELSPEEYAKLSDEEKKAYKERWMAWKQSQAK